MSSRLNTQDHKESHKHEEEPKATAKGHGIDRSMVAQGNHKGSGAPKFSNNVNSALADADVEALDDERGAN